MASIEMNLVGDLYLAGTVYCCRNSPDYTVKITSVTALIEPNGSRTHYPAVGRIALDPAHGIIVHP